MTLNKNALKPGSGGQITNEVSVSNPTGKNLSSQGLCSGFGQYHSPKNRTCPRDYGAITLDEIKQLAAHPQKVPKENAQWAIFSSLFSRIHAEQRDKGRFFALWADIDEQPDRLTFDDIKGRTCEAVPGVNLITYTSKGATEGNQKCRLIFPLAGPVDGSTFIILQKILNDKLTAAGIIPDRATERAGQVCYLPNQGEYYRYHFEQFMGPLDPNLWADEIAQEQQRIKDAEKAAQERTEQARLKAAMRIKDGTESPIEAFNAEYSIELMFDRYKYIKRGDRWVSPNSESGKAGVKKTRDGIKGLSTHESDAGIGTPTSNGTMFDSFDLFCYYEHGNDRDAALRAAAEMFGITAGLAATAPPSIVTDSRAADYFAETISEVKYWQETKKWLVYDGTRWTTDAPGGAFPAIKTVLADMYEHARSFGDEEQRTNLLKQIIKLESHSRQCQILAAASNVPKAIVTGADLDRDPWALNCRNGTLDLKTGELRQHKKSDYITRLVNIDYDPAAVCPTFDAFINRIMQGNPNLVNYVRRFIGYCLTGETTEQTLVFFYGTGANGKTTLLTIIEQLLGDFSSTSSADLLMQRDHRGTGNDLAALRGARVASISEFNDSEQLDEARIKTLTGGDSVSCRFLYGEFFSYRPQFKIILVGNHKPRIRGRDLGIWRRIHLLPFKEQIPESERDPHLVEKLRAELPGILAWAVRGCLEWQEAGLVAPDEIKNEVQEYKHSEDILSQWIEERCKVGHQFQAAPKDLLNNFQEFSNWRNLSAQKFGRMLAEAGFEKAAGGNRYWRGLDLVNDYSSGFI